MEQHQPTFEQRVTTMKETAEQLQRAAEIVLVEAERMDAARARFAARERKSRS